MALKIIHTGDWHLGKKLYKVSRLEEQKLFLDWLIEFIREQGVHALCLAGDVFDSPRPSDEALRLYFDFLDRFEKETEAKLFIISGNHDSGKFLEAPEALLEASRIVVKGQLDPTAPLPTEFLCVDNEQLSLTLFPYFRGSDLALWARHHGLDRETPPLEVLDHLFASARTKGTRLLMAHHLFGSFMPAGSEQGLHLSGLDTIPLRLLSERFDYVALGHIHKAQVLKHEAPHIRYAGSPLPFRFSENRDKEITLIEIENQCLTPKSIALPRWRELKSLLTNQEQMAEDILAHKPTETPQLKELWEIRCQLTSPSAGLPDLARELLKEAPVELINFQTLLGLEEHDQNEDQTAPQRQALTTEALFEAYYLKKYPEEEQLPADLRREFLRLLEEVRGHHEDPQA